MEKPESYHQILRQLMDDYAHLAYRLTKGFPQAELYGITSQLRRAALSVILNYIEGYARRREKINKNFLEISYGSLKESVYLLDFALVEGYLPKSAHGEAKELADRIGKMLWGIIEKI